MEYTAQKEVAGKFATLVWIGSGLYLYLTTHGPSLFSWSALGFFVAGMFAATIIFGMAFYLVKRGIARVLTIALGAPTQRIAQLIRALGGVLFIVEIVVIFLAASLPMSA